MTQDELKRMVARRAVDEIRTGMVVGLGTGTTSRMFVEELAVRLASGGLVFRCVASSDAISRLAASLGLPMTSLEESPQLDIYVDGADEIAPGLALIKGGGGALLREKIVASAAARFVVIADSSKLVDHLGKAPVPVEVIKMAAPVVRKTLERMNLHPSLRRGPDAQPWRTDEDNYIFDCACGEIQDPASLAAEIRSIVGVVEHGLFLNMASLALIASDKGVSELSA